MNLLARFEGVAELLFTGAFKKNTARLQPVEIAKELAKTMFRNKQISISQVYVPNVYRVFLHSDDWRPLAGFGEAFLIELSKYLYAEGERAGYTFLSRPAIELHADETVKLRELVIEVDFDDSIVVDWPDDEDDEQAEKEDKPSKGAVSPNDRPQSGEMNEGKRSEPESEASESRNYEYFLEVIDGPDRSARFALQDAVLHIGRHSQCELVLHDPEISRRHLKIMQSDRGWLVDDLGSTNGTSVNGQRITRQITGPGDKIQLGQTTLVIKRVAGI